MFSCWLQQVDTSRWKTGNIFPLAFTTPSTLSTYWIPATLLPSFLGPQTVHKQQSLFSPPDPYTKLLPGGCCSRNEVQAFDPTPDHWLKGCHFSFRPLSIPRQLFISKPGRHTFFFFPSFLKSHSHILNHVTSPFCPPTSYFLGTAFSVSTNT